jgi:Family of unknown function (DUF6065)
MLAGTPPCVTFYRLIDGIRIPERASPSAAGTLPTRATQYCDAVTSASAFGWWLFPPMDFALIWDGSEVLSYFEGMPGWMPLQAAQFPNFSSRFDQAAPEDAQRCSPPFLTVLREPGTIQIWTGLIARTAPDWSLLVRAPSNLPCAGGFTLYDGIVESDRWFGPLFVNLRITRTFYPIRLQKKIPLAQVQPLPRVAYSAQTLDNPGIVPLLEEWTSQDWEDYRDSIIRPNDEPARKPGRYAVAAPKRRKSGCPYAQLGQMN